MNTYRLHAYPSAPYWSWNFHATPIITAEALAQTLSGVVIRQLSASPHGGYDLDIRLDRPSHQDAIADIESALRQFGFDTAQAVITEWVTSVVEGALLGGAGGTAIGSASKDPVAIVVGAIIGLLVGAAVGSAMQTVKATYEANRLHPFGGGWHLTVVPPPDMHLGPQAWSPA